MLFQTNLNIVLFDSFELVFSRTWEMDDVLAWFEKTNEAMSTYFKMWGR